MKRCPRCGRYINDGSNVCLGCGYSEKEAKREYCPECGAVLYRGYCRKCEYRKSGLKNVCPTCGRAIKDGVCRKCGYEYKESDETCPYCGGQLVDGYCYACNYKKGETARYLLIIAIVLVCVAAFLMVR